MARDSSGNYSLPGGTNPVVTGTTITVAWGNGTANDIATELQDSLSRSGKGGMLSALKLSDGTVAAPGLTFTSDPTTGFWRNGSGDIRFAVAGIETLKILAASFTAPAFIPTSSTIPTNGMYLSAANTPSIASNTTLRWSVNANGAHAIVAPTAGVLASLTVNQAGTIAGINVTGGTNPFYQVTDGTVQGKFQAITASGVNIGSVSADTVRIVANNNAAITIVSAGAATFASSATANSFIPNSATVPTNGMYLSAANTPAIASNTTLRWSVNSAGNHTFAAPSSGTALTVRSATGAQALDVGLAGGTINPRIFTTHTEATGISDLNFTFSSGGSGTISCGSSTIMALSAAGNVVVNAPSSGIAMTVGGTSASGFTPVFHVTGGANSFLTVKDTTNVVEVGTGTSGTTGFAGSLTNHTFNIRANNTAYISITGAGVVSAWEGTTNVGAAALMQAATVESGSFTGTLTGCTTSPANTINWRRVGTLITLDMAANLLATSNSTAVTITGLPAGLSPARLQRCATSAMEDNTATVAGYVSITGGSTVLTGVRADGAAFTGSGTKGFIAFVISYNLT